MNKINAGRVILGGLLAGLVLNIGEFLLNNTILGKQWEAAMQALNLPLMSGRAVVWFIVISFLMGIPMVWLYAAVRPRLGAGPKTALVTGLVVWFLVWLLGFGHSLVTGEYPTKLVWSSIIWGFFEVPIATLAGTWLYKEG